ncbi:MAG TPA: sigma-70 family RNA polymerase sigma factor [Thermoanaerobaculia bacterium]
MTPPAAGAWWRGSGILGTTPRRPPSSAMTTPAHQANTNDPADAVADAYAAHYTLLRYIVERRYHVPEADVDAVIHEVFVAFIRNRQKVEDERRWLVGTTYNWCRLYWRNAGRDRETVPAATADAVAPDQLMKRFELRDLMRRLGSRCQDILRLRYAEDYSSAQLASHFGTTVEYARRMVYRCMRSARKLAGRGNA